MTLEEMKARIEVLLANHNRQPADDAELETLQREVGLASRGITPDAVTAEVTQTEIPMSVLKEQAKAKGIMYRVGMTKVALLNAIKEIEKII